MMLSPSYGAIESFCEHCGSRSLPLQLKSRSRSLHPSRFYPTSESTPSQKTALVNVRVFDGYKVGDPTTVIIDGDRIGSSFNAVGVTMVDGEGGVLIPGLIDAHCHVDTEAKLRTLPTYGVTTALDMEAWPLSIVHEMKALAGRNGYADYFSAGLATTFHSPLPFPAGMIQSIAKAPQWVTDRVHEDSGQSLVESKRALGR